MMLGAVTPMTDPLRYLAIGDSYTIGENVAIAERWPEQLATRLRGAKVALCAPVIIARTGWTTDELDAALNRAETGKAESMDGNDGALRPPYALVTLLIGVNNQFRGRDVEAYRGELRGLIARAIGYAGEQPGQVILLSIPDWSATPFGQDSGYDLAEMAAQIDAYNTVKREESARAKVAFVDITESSRAAESRPERVAGDGLHPSAREYARWVDAVLPFAREALANSNV